VSLTQDKFDIVPVTSVLCALDLYPPKSNSWLRTWLLHRD